MHARNVSAVSEHIMQSLMLPWECSLRGQLYLWNSGDPALLSFTGLLLVHFTVPLTAPSCFTLFQHWHGLSAGDKLPHQKSTFRPLRIIGGIQWVVTNILNHAYRPRATHVPPVPKFLTANAMRGGWRGGGTERSTLSGCRLLRHSQRSEGHNVSQPCERRGTLA